MDVVKSRKRFRDAPLNMWFYDDEDTSPPQLIVSLLQFTSDRYVGRLGPVESKLMTNDSNEQLAAVGDLIKLLYADPRLEDRLQLVTVHRIVSFLDRAEIPLLQIRATVLIRKFVWTKYGDKIIDIGVVSTLLQLTKSQVFGVQVKALDAVAAMSFAFAKAREAALKNGGLNTITSLISDNLASRTTANYVVLKLASGNLTTFCAHSNLSDEQIHLAFETLRNLLQHIDDQHVDDQILYLACLGLSNLSYRRTLQIDDVTRKRIFDLMFDESPSVLMPALGAVGNIMSFGDDDQIESMVVNKALPHLGSLLKDDDWIMRREACFIISNVTAGDETQIDVVIQKGLFNTLVNLLENDVFDIKKEAAFAISNAISGANHEQIEYFSNVCIKPFCDLLASNDPRIVTICLEGLEKILDHGEDMKIVCNGGDVNQCAQAIDVVEGFKKLKMLKSEDSKENYEKAKKILNTYKI